MSKITAKRVLKPPLMTAGAIAYKDNKNSFVNSGCILYSLKNEYYLPASNFSFSFPL